MRQPREWALCLGPLLIALLGVGSPVAALAQEASGPPPGLVGGGELPPSPPPADDPVPKNTLPAPSPAAPSAPAAPAAVPLPPAAASPAAPAAVPLPPVPPPAAASPAAPAAASPAAPAPLAVDAAPPAGPGGFWPFVQSCLCGPRIGLEANEGRPATAVEYLNFFIPIIVPIQTLGSQGFPACIASCSLPMCAWGLGPRIGEQLPARKIRTLEWLRVVPVLNIYASIVNGFEAADGRTMSQIVEEERLQR